MLTLTANSKPRLNEARVWLTIYFWHEITTDSLNGVGSIQKDTLRLDKVIPLSKPVTHVDDSLYSHTQCCVEFRSRHMLLPQKIELPPLAEIDLPQTTTRNDKVSEQVTTNPKRIMFVFFPVSLYFLLKQHPKHPNLIFPAEFLSWNNWQELRGEN